MQHLDDALIAEWVDGAIAEHSPEHVAIAAHVELCDECRLRVEEERALAVHVRQLLGVATPPDRVPPFEEVLHRAGTASHRTRGPRTVWVRRLAWAATVVVAGGVGWYARGALIGVPRPEEPASLAEVVGAAEATGAAEQTGPTGTAVPAGATPADAAERDAAFRDAAVALDQERPAAGREAVPPAREEAVAGAQAAGVEGRRENAADERRTAEEVGLTRQRRDAAARAAAPAAPEPRPMAQAVAAAENERQLAKTTREPWTVTTRAAAEAVLGAPLALLAGVPVTAIEVSADSQAVRVRQDLGPGVTLELVQSRTVDAVASGLAAGAVTDAEDRLQRAQAAPAVETRVINGIWIVARAPVTADSLRALVGRLGT